MRAGFRVGGQTDTGSSCSSCACPRPKRRSHAWRNGVSEGGHDVPEPLIRRRFHAGWRNFEHVYRDLVDVWAVFDNSGGAPKLIAEGSRE